MSEEPAAPKKGLVTATWIDTLAVLGQVAAPTFAKGPIIRRPKAVALVEWLNLDAKAVERLQTLRDKYGTGPVLLPIPGRPEAVILDGDQARRILEAGPEPFSPDSREKNAALGHFEEKASLVSSPDERKKRRAFNARVLEEACPVHSLAATMMRMVDEEIAALVESCGEEMTWDAFFASWNRIVRRTVLGDGAADDEALTEQLEELRSAANWAFLHPRKEAVSDSFHDAIISHLARADKGSLAESISFRNGDDTAAAHQVAHYLFAFDPGGMTTFRALGLLAAHPEAMARAAQEASGGDDRDLRFLRACIVETLRLYPTTPAILRETTEDVECEGGVLEEGTGVLIFAPFFHRDDTLHKDAHRFDPDAWLGIDPERRPPFVPFSAGPAVCPARHFVPMIASAAIASLLRRRKVVLLRPDLPAEKLPGTLNNYRQVFRLEPLGT
ncbi:cytochrome P450 [Plastorhodobacter daqingensis]|uniref:Cytochrome P450 n=1 Tax=Plastorhodobacter daqingensis TaxID=1387281 RepID=A0ABW2UNP1_9RHOB